MKLNSLALSLWMAALPAFVSAQEAKFLNGVDANYSAQMASTGATWEGGRNPGDLFQLLKRNGVDAFRTRMWVTEAGMSTTAYAMDVAGKAQAAGIRPYLVLFLSENWSDYVKQPAPAAWQGLGHTVQEAA